MLFASTFRGMRRVESCYRAAADRPEDHFVRRRNGPSRTQDDPFLTADQWALAASRANAFIA